MDSFADLAGQFESFSAIAQVVRNELVSLTDVECSIIIMPRDTSLASFFEVSFLNLITLFVPNSMD
jgi:hypothetical protein